MMHYLPNLSIFCGLHFLHWSSFSTHILALKTPSLDFLTSCHAFISRQQIYNWVEQDISWSHFRSYYIDILQGIDRLISQRKNKGKTTKEGKKNNLAVIQSLIEQVDSIQFPWRMTIDPWAFFFIALARQLSNIRIPFGSVSKFEGGCQEGID